MLLLYSGNFTLTCEAGNYRIVKSIRQLMQPKERTKITLKNHKLSHREHIESNQHTLEIIFLQRNNVFGDGLAPNTE